MTSYLSDQQRLLLNRLLDEEDVPLSSAPVASREGDRSTAPLSFGQERLYLAQQMRPDSPMYVASGALRFSGDLGVPALERALRLLLDRHEALRTAFLDDGDGVRQIILESAAVHLELPVVEVAGDDVRAWVADFASTSFDLARAPLLRSALLRVRDSDEPEWVLVLSVHHILVDGWSLQLLIDELGVLYRALVVGERPDIPETSLQYADFAVWQRKHLTDVALAAQLAYWREHLDGLATGDVPSDRPRPPVRSYSGDSAGVIIAAPVMARARKLAAENRVTLFMLLAAAFAVVLRRWTREDDVVIGTPLAGRRRAELERVVGFFVNTVPLRIRPNADDTFLTLLEKTREVCTAAYDNQDVPFERIIEEAVSERDESGLTVCARYWLVLHNTPPLHFEAHGVRCSFEPSLVGTVRCDLSLQLVPAQDGGLTGWLEYSTEMFDPRTAARLTEAFESVVGAAVTSPELGVDSLPVMSQQAERVLLGEYSTGPELRTTTADLVSLMEWQCDQHPDALAVLADATGQQWHAQEIDALSNQVSHALIARGIGPEHRVGVCLDRGAELVAALVGILKTGAVYVPFDPDLPSARIAALVDEALPAVTITTEALAQQSTAFRDVLLVADIQHCPRNRPAVAAPASHNAAYILFTSGSAGRPKGVVCAYGGLLNRLLGQQQAYELSAADVVLCKSPAGFDVSLWEMLWPLLKGATMVCARPGGQRDVDYLHEVIDRAGVTVCHFVPSMLHAFVTSTSPAHPSLRLLLCGGEELPSALAERALARYPDIALYNQYGPTEAVIDVSAGRVNSPAAAHVPMGSPVPGAELYVLDKEMRPQPIGVPGQLFIGGVQIARCYLGRAALTAEKFLPNPFRTGQRLYATGDRVRWTDGGSLVFLGRTDRQVKIRGNRVEPGEIETALHAHPAVERAVVDTILDEDDQPQLVAYVNPAQSEVRIAPVLLGYLRSMLPSAAVPTHLVTVEEWPTGVNGKLDMTRLPAPQRQRPGHPEDNRTPRTAVETAIAAVFSDVLGVPDVSVGESFFELGGHSLLAIRAISRIRADLKVALRIGDFFNCPTVKNLAELVGTASQHHEDAAPIPKLDRSRYQS